MLRLISVMIVGSLTVLLTGCAGSMSSDTYSQNAAMQMQDVLYGTVEGVRGVRIEGTRSPIGVIGGAIVGGLLGSTVGGGRGKDLATVGGAIAGGVAGSAIEQGTTQQNGVEITVRLDNGRVVSIVQAVDNQRFSPGQRVQVITAPNGVSRVTAG
ncbi:MAG: glycine zipper 2TM domain-containing protein [Halothiobacillus sp.]|jgi:outer membrane lipoprotein SlyB|nr:glycine zipper 2TM domain-containing protein [Halothiobacillus sp.]